MECSNNTDLKMAAQNLFLAKQAASSGTSKTSGNSFHAIIVSIFLAKSFGLEN
jgi:hypothetical protein